MPEEEKEIVEEVKEVIEEGTEEIAPPVEQGSVDDKEPRLRYKGQIVLSTHDRVVGAQTFQHIVCGDGTEYDLSEQEHRTQVIVSYPPHK